VPARTPSCPPIGIGGDCAEASALLFNHSFVSKAQVDPKDSGVPTDGMTQLLRSSIRVRDVGVK